MVTIINNINFLRVLTIIVAAAFVPAFLYGVASVWSIVFAVLMAVHMRAYLINTLNKCKEVQQADLESWFVKRKLLFLVAEGVFILMLPIILLMIYSYGSVGIENSLDTKVYSKLQSSIFESMPKDTLTFEIRLVFSTLFTFLCVLSAFFLIATKKMYQVFLKYYHVVSPHYLEDKNNIKVSYSSRRHMFPLLAGVIPLFMYSFMTMSLDDGVASAKLLFLFNLSFNFLSYFCFILLVALSVSVRRMNQSRDKQEVR